MNIRKYSPRLIAGLTVASLSAALALPAFANLLWPGLVQVAGTLKLLNHSTLTADSGSTVDLSGATLTLPPSPAAAYTFPTPIPSAGYSLVSNGSNFIKSIFKVPTASASPVGAALQFTSATQAAYTPYAMPTVVPSPAGCVLQGDGSNYNCSSYALPTALPTQNAVFTSDGTKVAGTQALTLTTVTLPNGGLVQAAQASPNPTSTDACTAGTFKVSATGIYYCVSTGNMKVATFSSPNP